MPEASLRHYAAVAWLPDDIIELRPLKPNMGERVWTRAGDLGRHIPRMIEENRRGANMYAGILPRNKFGFFDSNRPRRDGKLGDWVGGKIEDVDGGRVLWIDLDDIEAEKGLELVCDLGLPMPSMAVATGHGAHIFWRLRQWTGRDAIAERLERLVGWLQSQPTMAPHIDKASKDPARILRLPGFINHKPPAGPARLLFADPDIAYGLEEFEPFLISAPDSATRPSPSLAHGQASAVTERCRRYLATIPGSGPGGRTNAAFRAACVMINDIGGIDDGVAVRLLAGWDVMSNNPTIAADYGADEIARIVANARRYAKKPEGCLNTPRVDVVNDEVDIGGILRKGTIKEIQFPRRLFNVGGFIGDVMDYTLARAAVPNPVAALAGAIAFQAMLCGGKAAFHAEEETRSNCYIIILTGSTTGKNAPRKTNIEIINRIGEECARTEAQKKMVDAVIANSFASGQGIVSTIAASQSVLFQVDEMDKLLAQLSTNKDRQAREIERQLMEMYSSSTSIYYPDKRADKDKQPNPIEYPNLCVLGTATPGVFYDSLSFDSLRNGLVGRLIPMECKDKPTRLTLRDIQGRQGAAMLPQSVINTAWHWLRDDQDLFRQVKTAPYDPEVVDLLSEASQDIAYAAIDTAIEEYGPECAEATIWGRYNENRNKLILIRACSDNPLAPRITKETARWGIDLTEYSCRLLCEAVRGHVAENLFHRQMLKALDTIKTKGRDNPDGWVFFRDIHRALNRTTKETQDIFNALLEQEKIEIEEVTRGTKKTFRVRERLT